MDLTKDGKRKCSPLSYETTLEGFMDETDGKYATPTVMILCLLFLIIGAGLGYKYGLKKAQY